MSDSSPAKFVAEMGSSLRKVAADFWRAGWDFVYPPACFLCGAEIPVPAMQKFCRACLPDLAPAIPHACQRCGAPVGPYLNTTLLGCPHCRTTPFHFDNLLQLGVYKNLLRRACLTIKMPGKEPLAHALAELLWLREGAKLERANVQQVFCVPQHWTQRLLSGHNPSETLARWFAERLRVPCDVSQVRKTRRTPQQGRLPSSRRRTNLQKAFRLHHPSSIAGQHILLVDDVLTTGTTVNRICRLLQKAGAKSITVAVIARGLGDAR